MLSLPNQHRHSQDDSGEIDPETNQLIPSRKRLHRVRVQGRLAVVRSVSTVNLRPAASVPVPVPPSPVATSGTASPATPRFESGVAGSTVPPVRRRRSLDDASSDAEEEEVDVKETAVRDRQFRGYGIGGAGNIRRPTDVYGSRKSSSSASRFSTFYSHTSPDVTDKKAWSLKDLFARAADRKGKGVAS